MRITTPNRTIYTKETAKAIVALTGKPAAQPIMNTFQYIGAIDGDAKYAIMENYRALLRRSGNLRHLHEMRGIARIINDELDELRVQNPCEVDADYHYATIEVLADRIKFWEECAK